MALIKCPNCGKEFSEYAEKCPQCGLPLEQVQQLREEEQRQLRKKRKKVYKIIAIGGSLIACVVLVIVAQYYNSIYGFLDRLLQVPVMHNTYSEQTKQNDGFLIPVQHSTTKKYGYVNKDGVIVVPLINHYVSDCSEGRFFIVNKENNAPYSLELIDAASNRRLRCTYFSDFPWPNYIPRFKDGKAWMFDGDWMYPINRDGEIDKDGGWHFKQLGNEHSLKNDYTVNNDYIVSIWEEEEYLYSYIVNRFGEILSSKYSTIGNPSDGLIRVDSYGWWGYLDANSYKEVLPLRFSYANDFHDGYAVVSNNNNNYLINKDGKKLFSAKWIDVGGFNDGWIRCETTRGNYIFQYFADVNGKVLANKYFDRISIFSNGKALVRDVDGNTFYIDESGNVLSHLDKPSSPSNLSSWTDLCKVGASTPITKLAISSRIKDMDENIIPEIRFTSQHYLNNEFPPKSWKDIHNKWDSFQYPNITFGYHHNEFGQLYYDFLPRGADITGLSTTTIDRQEYFLYEIPEGVDKWFTPDGLFSIPGLILVK